MGVNAADFLMCNGEAYCVATGPRRRGFATGRSLLIACLLSVIRLVLVSAGDNTTDAAALKQLAIQTNYTIWLSHPGHPCSVSCNRITKVELLNYGLTGQFPAYLDQPALDLLQLSNGKKIGSLPSAWSTLFPHLQQLDLSHNNISGNIPDAWMQSETFSSLATLSLIGAFNKNTTRDLPFQSGQPGMANLISLNLALCNITGSLTTAWGASFNHLTH